MNFPFSTTPAPTTRPRFGLLALLLAFVVLPASPLWAQDEPEDTPPPKPKGELTIGGYVDVYYGFYTDSLGRDEYQKFPTISPRSEQFGINFLQLNMQYTHDRVRAKGAIFFGDAPRSTWNPSFPNIEYANIGVRLAKNLWIDGGFFQTHIGTELLFPRDNITSSISVGTYHEPYFQSGLELTWTPTERLTIKGLLLNGYNNFTATNRSPGGGLLVSYAVNDNLSLSYTNILTNEKLDTVDRIRFYNNAYVSYVQDFLTFIVGGDMGYQSNSSLDSIPKGALMFSAEAIMKVQFAKRAGIYFRGEIFQDPNGFLSGTITQDDGKLSGFKIFGLTAGLEFKPMPENSYLRLEYRMLSADQQQKIFYWGGNATQTRHEITVTAGVFFDSGNLLK